MVKRTVHRLTECYVQHDIPSPAEQLAAAQYLSSRPTLRSAYWTMPCNLCNSSPPPNPFLCRPHFVAIIWTRCSLQPPPPPQHHSGRLQMSPLYGDRVLVVTVALRLLIGGRGNMEIGRSERMECMWLVQGLQWLFAYGGEVLESFTVIWPVNGTEIECKFVLLPV
jgi:hypothetical protein